MPTIAVTKPLARPAAKPILVTVVSASCKVERSGAPLGCADFSRLMFSYRLTIRWWYGKETAPVSTARSCGGDVLAGF